MIHNFADLTEVQSLFRIVGSKLRVIDRIRAIIALCVSSMPRFILNPESIIRGGKMKK